MKQIGILVAMEEELEAVKKEMKEIKKKTIYELEFFVGKIQEKMCILVKCGVGKVNAARTTQIMIDKFDIDYIMNSSGIPKCDKCGGTVRPDVVLYEEGLDGSTIYGAVAAIEKADVLIVGGTSLNVYPAAGLIDYYRGNKLVLINKSVTPYDRKANLIIRENIGQVFKEVLDL